MSAPGDEVGALLSLGRDADAAQRAGELLATSPDDVTLLLNGGAAWSRIGDAPRATAAIEQALGLQPDDAEVHRIASVVLGRCARHAEAFTHAHRAVELAPHSAAAHRVLADAAADRRKRSELDIGERAAREAIRLDPSHAESHNGLGRVLLRRRKALAAADAFRAALARDPDEAAYHQNLAIALEAIGDRAGASEHLVAAGRADPTSDEPITRLRRLARFSVPTIVAIVGVQFVRIGTQSTSTGTIGLAIVVPLLAALAIVLIVTRRPREERHLHPDAVAALDADRRMRRKR